MGKNFQHHGHLNFLVMINTHSNPKPATQQTVYIIKALRFRKGKNNPPTTELHRCECYSHEQALRVKEAFEREFDADQVVIEQHKEPENVLS